MTEHAESLPVSGSEAGCDESFVFGAFRLDPVARSLAMRGMPVRLGERALDILTLLIRRAGETVDKASLFAAAWPNIVVEDSNLRVQIAHLNKELGGDSGTRLIENVPGRGYRFAGSVRRVNGSSASSAPSRADTPSAVPIFGRDQDLARLAALLLEHRFVSISGPGGIGKTTLAVTLLDRIRADYRDGVAVVDLASLAISSPVAEHVASVLQVSKGEGQGLEAIVRHLRERSALLVLDNCERVIDATARIAETIASQAPQMRILVTSREPTRARGEWVFPLAPLAAPPQSASMTTTEVMRYPAAQLLRARAIADGGSFDLVDADAPYVAEICAKLDGLPLALELAAVRLPSLGLRAVAARLDDRFDLLTKGRRTADPRHQSLSALIDWSYETLAEPSRKVWRRIASFAGNFTIEGAVHIASLDGESEATILDALDDLTGKSLVLSERMGSAKERRFRLLETMRLYAYRRLVESGEEPRIRERLALHLLQRLVAIGNGWDTDQVASWARSLADIRDALEWGFSPTGEATIAIRLVTESAPLWFKLLLAPELRTYLERAREALMSLPDIDDIVRAKLHLALGHAIFHAHGPQAMVEASLRAGLEAAERGGHTSEQLQIIWSLFGNELALGSYEGVQRNADALSRAGSGERRSNGAIEGQPNGFSRQPSLRPAASG